MCRPSWILENKLSYVLNGFDKHNNNNNEKIRLCVLFRLNMEAILKFKWPPEAHSKKIKPNSGFCFVFVCLFVWFVSFFFFFVH